MLLGLTLRSLYLRSHSKQEKLLPVARYKAYCTTSLKYFI